MVPTEAWVPDQAGDSLPPFRLGKALGEAMVFMWGSDQLDHVQSQTEQEE